jgi:hypothetical protein
MHPAVGWQHKELPPRSPIESGRTKHFSRALLKKGVMGWSLFDESSLTHPSTVGRSIHSLVHIQQGLRLEERRFL